MWYGNTKIYFDGSHYIGIPHTEKPYLKRRKKPEEIISVEESQENSKENKEDGSLSIESNEPIFSYAEENSNENEIEKTQNNEKIEQKFLKISKKITKKDYFNELYDKYIDLKKSERKKKIISEMLPYFNEKRECEVYVEVNFERKLRNLIARRVRMCRKANLAGFNYFCTFTYDDKLHSEESFKKKLKTCFKMMCFRKGWKYMGVWERAPKTKRLHFHGLFCIPSNTIPGELITVKDYNKNTHKMQECIQSTYFNSRFGRSDFREIDEYDNRLGNAVAYLMKYIEKTGEKIVYSKGLPQYFISDILEEDIVCHIGQEDKKILLFDDFKCLDEGVLIGTVSKDVIAQMKKCNS